MGLVCFMKDKEGRGTGVEAVKVVRDESERSIHVMIQLSEQTEFIIPRLNPNEHCGLWAIKMC